MTQGVLKCSTSLTQSYIYLEASFPSLPAELPPLWVELCTPRDVVVQIPVPVNMISFGYRAFADGQVKMGSLGETLIQYYCALIKRQHLDTEDRHSHGENTM